MSKGHAVSRTESLQFLMGIQNQFQMSSQEVQISEEEKRTRQVDSLRKRDKIMKEKSTVCGRCPKQFKTLINIAKFCVFCNQFVCSDHMIKQREDPFKPGEFMDICEFCEDDKLFNILMARYTEAENIQQNSESKYRIELAQLQEQISEYRNELTNKEKQQIAEEENHKIEVDKQNQLIFALSQKLKQLETDAETYHQTYEKLLEKNKIVEAQRVELNAEYEKTKQDEKVYLQQLNNIEMEVYELQVFNKKANEEIARRHIFEQQRPKKPNFSPMDVYQETQNTNNHMGSFYPKHSVFQSISRQQNEERKQKEIQNQSIPESDGGFYCLPKKAKKNK